MVLEQALAVFRPMAYKTAIFKGSCSKTEVLEQPQILIRFGAGSVVKKFFL
jgi:hypothetical protein